MPYYVRRSLQGYPGRTPLAGLAAGCEAIARQLPVGSPALLFALRHLAQRAQQLLQQPGSAGATQQGLDLINLLAHLMLIVEFGVRTSAAHPVTVSPAVGGRSKVLWTFIGAVEKRTKFLLMSPTF